MHVAIIMDGNGRWAMRRGLPRVAGHRAGVAAVRRVVERAPDVGISRLTLYAFSCDNWRRPSAEVQSIFWLLRAFLRLETERLRQRDVRVQIIGRRDRLAASVLREIEKAECATADGTGLHLRVAIDYSSRDAITRAAAGANAALCMEGPPTPDVLGPMLTRALIGESGEVDLLIRTGGETRLSDFLLWECAYAELLFTDRMWPDFDQADLDSALEEFRRRERRFGGYRRSRRSLPQSKMMDTAMAQPDALRRIRFWLGVFIIGLVVSGVTAFPLQTELSWLVSALRASSLQPLADSTHLLPWIEKVNEGLVATNAHFPFLAYGTDWLAFAHLVIAVVFVGPYIDPVRNKWVITFGLIACAGVLPLALIAGHIRGIPLPWRLIDCSFGILGAVPLLFCRQSILALERRGRL